MVVWISGFMLVFYIIALSITARAEARGRVSPAARLWLLALLFTPLIGSLGFSASLGEMRNVLLISPAFVVTVGYALMKMRQGGAAIGQGVGWMLSAIPAVDALAVAPCSLPLALAFVALIPLLRLWQRCIAAT